MNKKKYIAPKVTCIDIDCESIMANSPYIYYGGEDEGVAIPEAPMQRGSDWDDYFTL